MTHSAVLDSISTAPSLRAALVDQLAVIRPLAGDPQDLETAHGSGDCYVLAGALSNARRLDLDLVGAAGRWHSGLDADALPLPAKISVSDADGERVLSLLYESPLRAAWPALHDALHGGAPLPYAAAQLADDLAIAEAALGPGAES